MSETRHHVAEFTVATRGRAFIDITADAASWVRGCNVRAGLLTLFIRHTSASLTVQENADPDVQADLLDALDRLAPENAGWRHSAEGPDDMPAHVKAALTHTSLSVPVIDGALALGTWQAIYVIEHRARGGTRRVAAHLAGSS